MLPNHVRKFKLGIFDLAGKPCTRIFPEQTNRKKKNKQQQKPFVSASQEVHSLKIHILIYFFSFFPFFVFFCFFVFLFLFLFF